MSPDTAISPDMMISPAMIGLLLKLTAWCALPFVLRPLLARGSASTRHLLLTLTLAGTLLMPLLLVSAPTWQAPAWLRLPLLAAAIDGGVRPVAAPRLRVEKTSTQARLPLVHELRTGVDDARTPSAPVPARVDATPSRVESRISSTPGLSPHWPDVKWLSWIWLAGAALMTLRLGAAVLHASGIVRDAMPVEDPRVWRALAHARDTLRATVRPDLRQSRRSPVPFAWRGASPVVVLPHRWQTWDEERLRVVLVHELAHLSRHDALALWIGRAAIALWWFHPIVRGLERWAHQECEQAADDAVLLSGSRASSYAEHLIAISRALSPRNRAGGTRPFPSGVALTMSNNPDLKHRLLAILNADRPRRALTRRLAAGTSLVALACAVVLAGVRFAPVAQAQEPKPEVDVEVDADDHHGGHHWFHGHGDSDSDSESDSDSDSDSELSAGGREWKTAYEAHSEGRWDEAISGFEAAAATGYRPAVAIYNAACGMSMSGRADDALATLRRALDLGLDDPELIAEDSDLDPLRADDRFQAPVDEAFASAGERRDPIEHYRYRHAQEALDVLRETASEDAGAWSKIGTRLLTLRRLDDAAEALDNAARYAREAPATALYNLACAHALNGRTSDALGTLERSIEAGYSDAEHMRSDSDLASLRDDAEFERLATLAGDLDLGRFQHDAWHRKGKHKGKDKGHHGSHHGDANRYSAETWAPAVDHFRALVDEHPSLGAGWFNLGYALHYSERFEESVPALERARELGYRPATAAYNVACGYAMQNRVDDALAALEQAIELGFHSDLDHDSDLDNLRQDPRFRSLRLKMQLDRHG